MARLMLLGLLIAVAASGCGGAQHNKGARRAPAAANFDANATFACLLKRPEYSPSLPTGNVLRFTDVGGHPTPIPKHLPLSSITLGTGMDFDISFTGSSVPGGGFMFVDFKFFDDVQAARACRRRLRH